MIRNSIILYYVFCFYYTLIVIGATFLILFFVTSAFHTLMPQECVWGGGEGGAEIFIYIYVGWDHFWGLKILNFNIFGGFQKYHYFWGYEDFVDIS